VYLRVAQIGAELSLYAPAQPTVERSAALLRNAYGAATAVAACLAPRPHRAINAHCGLLAVVAHLAHWIAQWPRSIIADAAGRRYGLVVSCVGLNVRRRARPLQSSISPHGHHAF
jgi:hypothetical protein